MAKPVLTANISAEDFDSYYWTKAELTVLAQTLKVSPVGGKFEIHDRISHFLNTGERLKPARPKPTSNFNWQTEPLTLKTVITDSYKNNQNVRTFFTHHLGPSFNFNIRLMRFMKTQLGLTLQDAIDFYKDPSAEPEPIPDHNQFNQYTRDFMDAHPNKTLDDVRTCWQQVILEKRPGCKGRGFIYKPEDLQYLR